MLCIKIFCAQILEIETSIHMQTKDVVVLIPISMMYSRGWFCTCFAFILLLLLW